MQRISNRLVCLIAAALLFLLTGCAAKIENRPEDVRLVTAAGPVTMDYPAPVFLIPEWQQPYNRIGRVEAERHGECERIFINPQQAVFYQSIFSFTTGRGTYSNQVIRVHFQKIPFSLFPFHFGAGYNVGLLVIITRDISGKPLLITTVNTCGCYVAILPTSYLPAEAYPAGWPKEKQFVYGETLPAYLAMDSPEAALLISVRPAVHRVMDIQVVTGEATHSAQRVAAELQPLEELKNLPIGQGGTSSMYYQRWPLKGHVKGAIKPWESLLLSLISLDLYVGMDKEYGNTDASGNPFYTSLKPWNRRSSDMNSFAAFLRFHGWNL